MSNPPNAFLERVRTTIETHGLLPTGPRADGRAEPVVVAVSGGADSVALLLALHDLAHEGWPIDLVVAHLHHGLREDTADADQVFVENLARRLGVPCRGGRTDVTALARGAGTGIEETARAIRRWYLADIAHQAEARKVALAHHADDRAETVLFHVLRGTGVEGLASLAARAPLASEDGIEIVRPLIDVTRQEIVEFLESRGQAWREDETNRSDAHTRNRIRHEVIPLVREVVNPKAPEALVRLSDQAAAAADVLADALEDAWRRIVRPGPRGKGLAIDADDFAALRPWIQGAILRRAVDTLGGGLKHMGAQWTRAAAEALLAKTVAGPVDLPGNLVAERRRRAIRVGPKG